MDTKKTIIISVLTTLATMFIVALIMHMCCGNCGKQSSCSVKANHCSASASSDCGSKASCASYAKCKKSKKCGDKSSCKSDASSCKGEKVLEWTSEDGDKVVKKVIKVDVEEEK